MRAKLDGMVGRLNELDGLLAAENATRDLEQFKRLSREHAEVSSVVSLFNSYLRVERDAAEARELAADPAMKAYADEELRKSRAAMDCTLARTTRAVSIQPAAPTSTINTGTLGCRIAAAIMSSGNRGTASSASVKRMSRSSVQRPA